jgi:hypothetical protein
MLSVAESVIMATGGWTTASVFRRYAIVSNKDQTSATEALELKRAADKAKLEQEQAENSHSFSHSSATNARTTANATNRWTQ